MEMGQYNHNQAPGSYPYPAGSTAQGQGPYVAPPPPAGYPPRDGQVAHQKNAVPVETKSRGDGFWKGCCAALCCCCVLDACF